MKFEIEKFYPGPGIEPGPLAFICRIKREKFYLLPGHEPGPLAFICRIKE